MKKSQGEIFGIALMFVVLIIGFFVYAKIQSVRGDRPVDLQQEKEYELLSESTLNTIKKVSTGCTISRDKDSMQDLINYCLENDYSNYDPEIECDIGTVGACEYAKEIINTTIFKMFFTDENNNASLVSIPFELKIDVLGNSNTRFSNITMSNFGLYEYKGKIVDDNTRRKLGYKRAPSGLIQWSTAQRNIQFELYLYYR